MSTYIKCDGCGNTGGVDEDGGLAIGLMMGQPAGWGKLAVCSHIVKDLCETCLKQACDLLKIEIPSESELMRRQGVLQRIPLRSVPHGSIRPPTPEELAEIRKLGLGDDND